jgi:hypothetical protein
VEVSSSRAAKRGAPPVSRGCGRDNGRGDAQAAREHQAAGALEMPVIWTLALDTAHSIAANAGRHALQSAVKAGKAKAKSSRGAAAAAEDGEDDGDDDDEMEEVQQPPAKKAAKSAAMRKPAAAASGIFGEWPLPDAVGAASALVGVRPSGVKANSFPGCSRLPLALMLLRFRPNAGAVLSRKGVRAVATSVLTRYEVRGRGWGVHLHGC